MASPDRASTPVLPERPMPTRAAGHAPTELSRPGRWEPLSQRLAARVVVLDGGLSTALELDGQLLQDELWTARLLADDPEALVRAHGAFLAAGAEVVITASYQASIGGFRRVRGLDRTQAAELLASSVAVARRAVDRWRDRQWDQDAAPVPLVAASVGPYGAILADGSEYVGRYEVGIDELITFHDARIATLVGDGSPGRAPDVLACETIPCVDEAVALGRVLGRFDAVEAWVSFCCAADGRLVSGEDVADGVRAVLAGGGRVVAVGVNCTAPDNVTPALEGIRTVTDLPLLAYPNLGRTWDPSIRAWSGTKDSSTGGDDGGVAPELVVRWLALGVRLLGGCCGTTPEDIARLATLA